MLRQTDKHFKVEAPIFHIIESRIECVVITSHREELLDRQNIQDYDLSLLARGRRRWPQFFLNE
jgi:hypothetical protein